VKPASRGLVNSFLMILRLDQFLYLCVCVCVCVCVFVCVCV
jgi:hypothetical protein